MYSIFENMQKEIQQTKEKLKELDWFFGNLPITLDREGYKKRSIGAKAGPNIDISNILHEISHGIELVERKKYSRIGEDEWGIGINTKWNPVGFQEEVTTNAPSKMECRVFAIQYHLMQYLKLDDILLEHYAEENGDMLHRFMCDWFFNSAEDRKNWIIEEYNSRNIKTILQNFEILKDYLIEENIKEH